MNENNQQELVYTAYITLKNGKRIYAKTYGKKAFCFPKKKSSEQDKD